MNKNNTNSFMTLKFIPLCIMYVLMGINITVLRDLKDISLIGLEDGLSLIPYLKSLILPVCFITTLTYIYLSRIFSRQGLFYLVYGIFTLLLFPYALYENHSAWMIKSYYVVFSVWSLLSISILFWQFTNDIMTISEAKKSYLWFGFFASLMLNLTFYFDFYLPLFKDNSNTFLSISMIAINLVILGIYKFINHKRLTTSESSLDKGKIDHPQLPFIENLIEIFKSPYIWLLILIIICQGISMNLINILWKSSIDLNKAEYTLFMGNTSLLSGITSILVAPIAAVLLYRYSWKTNLLIAPLLTLAVILYLIAANSYIDHMASNSLWLSLHINELRMYVFTSAKILIACLSGIYFALLQIAYIPLKQELKVNGKIIIDFFLCTLIFSSETGLLTIPKLHTFFGEVGLAYTYPALIIICLLWIAGVYGLNKRFEKIAL